MQYKQQVFTPAEAGAEFLGWAQKTSRNKLTAGLYPFPVRLVAGKKMVLLSDIERTLAAAPVVAGAPFPPTLPPCAEQPRQPGRVRRGPPTLAERAKAEHLDISVKELRLRELLGEVHHVGL